MVVRLEPSCVDLEAVATRKDDDTSIDTSAKSTPTTHASKTRLLLMRFSEKQQKKIRQRREWYIETTGGVWAGRVVAAIGLW